MNDQGTSSQIRAETVPPGVRSYYEGREGCVYFISDGDSIKIGFSAIPLSRLADLQSSSPRELKMLGHFPGTMANEQDLHIRFREFHLRGEWFKSDPHILDLIAALKNGLRLNEAKSVSIPPRPQADVTLNPCRFPLEYKEFKRWAKKQKYQSDLASHAYLVECDLRILQQAPHIKSMANLAHQNFNEFEARLG